MGLGGIGIWQLVIILVIVLLLFGTKRLKGLGGDLGSAIKGFKKAVSDEGKGAQEDDTDTKKVAADETGETLDNESVPTSSEDETAKTESKS